MAADVWIPAFAGMTGVNLSGGGRTPALPTTPTMRVANPHSSLLTPISSLFSLTPPHSHLFSLKSNRPRNGWRKIRREILIQQKQDKVQDGQGGQERSRDAERVWADAVGMERSGRLGVVGAGRGVTLRRRLGELRPPKPAPKRPTVSGTVTAPSPTSRQPRKTVQSSGKPTRRQSSSSHHPQPQGALYFGSAPAIKSFALE